MLDKFDRNEKKSDDKNIPHPDASENVRWFNSMMKKVIWLPSERECPVTYKINDCEYSSIWNPEKASYEASVKVKEYMAILWLWDQNNVKLSHLITFHQPSRKANTFPGFREELCQTLNYFGSKGYLVHKLKENNGDTRKIPYGQKTSEWEKLFG